MINALSPADGMPSRSVRVVSKNCAYSDRALLTWSNAQVDVEQTVMAGHLVSRCTCKTVGKLSPSPPLLLTLAKSIVLSTTASSPARMAACHMLQKLVSQWPFWVGVSGLHFNPHKSQ